LEADQQKKESTKVRTKVEKRRKNPFREGKIKYGQNFGRTVQTPRQTAKRKECGTDIRGRGVTRDEGKITLSL